MHSMHRARTRIRAATCNQSARALPPAAPRPRTWPPHRPPDADPPYCRRFRPQRPRRKPPAQAATKNPHSPQRRPRQKPRVRATGSSPRPTCRSVLSGSRAAFPSESGPGPRRCFSMPLNRTRARTSAKRSLARPPRPRIRMPRCCSCARRFPWRRKPPMLPTALRSSDPPRHLGLSFD